jgi:hypothetical protein
MPISKQAFRDIGKTKKLIERLVELNLISLDLPVEFGIILLWRMNKNMMKLSFITIH